jgi:hypothetical protein
MFLLWETDRSATDICFAVSFGNAIRFTQPAPRPGHPRQPLTARGS